jgi:septal ring factor EnvC (AmiA/AmiB activator)
MIKQLFSFCRRQSTEAVKSTIQMCKQIHEQHTKVQKQKERLLRELKRAETQLRNVKDELTSANMTIEKLQLKVSINECNFRSVNR